VSDREAMQLVLPSEPAFAVTARVFVVTAARHHGMDERTVEDLRLAASELFTNALEQGRPEVTFTVAAGAQGPVLRAEGVGSLSAPMGDGDAEDVWSRTRRLDVLETLFDDLRVLNEDPGTVEIVLPRPS
jgi:anti-sigma regulatory factor (Ser/Thr protein kinase)